jgi:bifunctional non-homologous end joining protein LigD
VKVHGALQSPDGQWRVEVVQLRRPRYPRGMAAEYRLIHGDEVREGLAIGTVQYLLEEAGVDMGDLVEASTEPSA